MKKITFLTVVFFGVVSIVYSNIEWNLTKLSKADPSARAWMVQMKGDSVLVRSSKSNAMKEGKEKRLAVKQESEINRKFSDPYPIYEGDMIVTGVGDRATILLRDGSIIWVDSLTVFKISDLKVPSVVPGQAMEGYKVHLKLRIGAIRVRVPKVRTVQKKFSVQTPQGTASVRGTEQVVQYSPGFGLQVNVLSGLVEVENQSQGVEYASRGEKVAVSTEAGTGVQTVNQKRRSEVQKNIQIASGTASTENQEVTQEVTQEIQEVVQIALLPEEIPSIQEPKSPDMPSLPSLTPIQRIIQQGLKTVSKDPIYRPNLKSIQLLRLGLKDPSVAEDISKGGIADFRDPSKWKLPSIGFQFKTPIYKNGKTLFQIYNKHLK